MPTPLGGKPPATTLAVTTRTPNHFRPPSRFGTIKPAPSQRPAINSFAQQPIGISTAWSTDSDDSDIQALIANQKKELPVEYAGNAFFNTNVRLSEDS